MEGFYFSISGKSYKIQKVYNKLKNSLSNLELPYKSDSYIRMCCLPRGTSEIEVLDKKGNIVSYFGNSFSVYSNFTTSFIRKSGMILGYDSKLFIKINSHEPSKLVKISSSISCLDPVFEEKGNYGFIEEENRRFLDLV